MLAGSVTVDGVTGQARTAVSGVVTTYSLSGNITGATLTDRTPSVDETEVFYSRDSADGWEIVAANAFGDGSVRTIVSHLAQPAYSLLQDPSGKWIYYIRNNNIQRTDIRDGTSNTILAGASTFTFNESGTKVVYSKLGLDEIWTANMNGTSPALVATPGGLNSVIGCVDDNYVIVRRQAGGDTYQLCDIRDGSLGYYLSFSGYTFRWAAFNPSDRSFFLALDGSSHYLYKIFSPTPGHALTYYPVFNSAGPFPVQIGSCSPDGQSIAGTATPLHVALASITGGLYADWPFQNSLYSVSWGNYLKSLPLVGAGSSFTTGIGAILFSEVRNTTPVLVAADAVTRNSLVVESLNDTGSGNPLYQITGDNLNKLSYAAANGYIWQSVVSGPSGLKGAIVSFDGSTGKLANIVTFNKKPTVTRIGSKVKVEGELDEVINLSKGARKPAGRVIEIQ